MELNNFVVVDPVVRNANSLSRSLAEIGYSFPLSTVEELKKLPVENCTIFVSDTDGRLEHTLEFFRGCGTFYPVVPYASSPSVQRVVQAIRSGVVSYLNWPCNQEKLQAVVNSVTEASKEIIREGAEKARAERLVATLTQREMDVFRGIAVGQSNKEVARSLNISPRTVEIHRANVLTKLKARNAIDAIRLASGWKINEAGTALFH